MPLCNWSTTVSFSWRAVVSSKCGAPWATTSSAPSTARWGRRSFQEGKAARQLENFLLLILGCLVTIERLLRRADREAEGARLLSEYAPKGHLGFESPALRQYEFEEGSHLGPFLLSRMAAGDSNLKKGGILSDASLQWAYYSCALHLGRLGDGLAFCRERAVVDAAAQAIELHE